MKKFILPLGYIILIFIAISMLFPFLAMLNMAFTPENNIFNDSEIFFHTDFTIDNFKHVFNEIPITRYFFNSMLVAFITTIGQVIISALAGYSFARLNFKYKEFWFLVIFNISLH